MYTTKIREAYGFELSQTDTGIYHVVLANSQRETIDAWTEWMTGLSERDHHTYVLYDVRGLRLTPYILSRSPGIVQRIRDIRLAATIGILVEKSPMGRTLAQLINLRYFRNNPSMAYHLFMDEDEAWIWLTDTQKKHS